MQLCDELWTYKLNTETQTYDLLSIDEWNA